MNVYYTISVSSTAWLNVVLYTTLIMSMMHIQERIKRSIMEKKNVLNVEHRLLNCVWRKHYRAYTKWLKKLMNMKIFLQHMKLLCWILSCYEKWNYKWLCHPEGEGIFLSKIKKCQYLKINSIGLIIKYKTWTKIKKLLI